MIYVCSDLHGYPLTAFKELLKSVGFTKNDTLYILGDVIDRRGDGGVEMLSWIIRQKNVKMIMGNHERMLLDCKGIFDKSRGLRTDDVLALDDYLYNGGAVTIETLEKLREKDSGEFTRVMGYLEKLPCYDETEVNGRKFVFVHGGLEDFKSHRRLYDYDGYDLLWSRPEMTDEYFKTKTVILGHTPTSLYGEEYRGRIIITPTWINIDTGAAYGEGPALLRLDDMEVFYGEKTYETD